MAGRQQPDYELDEQAADRLHLRLRPAERNARGSHTQPKIIDNWQLFLIIDTGQQNDCFRTQSCFFSCFVTKIDVPLHCQKGQKDKKIKDN